MYGSKKLTHAVSHAKCKWVVGTVIFSAKRLIHAVGHAVGAVGAVGAVNMGGGDI